MRKILIINLLVHKFSISVYFDTFPDILEYLGLQTNFRYYVKTALTDMKKMAENRIDVSTELQNEHLLSI